jgi:DNA topoisomerase-2
VDDGPGIPVKILESDPKKRSCVELAWTQPRAGTSFNEDRRGPSANGIGSTASNIFSKVFKGTSDDGKHMQKIVCKNNLSKINASEFQPSSGQSGVKVYLEPDLERFGLKEITQTHIDLIHQRLINLSILFPELKFKFNGKTIKMTRKQFAGAFSDDFCIAQADNSFIVIFRNEYDEFKFFSYVNGLNAMRGGTQIDYCIGEVASRIRDKLIKKFKSIRPGDIKNKLGIIVFMSNVANLQFDAQTKESISNSQSDIKKYFESEKIDFDKLAKDVLKNENIIEQIVESFKLKEEVKNRIALKHSANAKVKIDASKYISPIGDQKKFLAICEGYSAMCGLSSALGRKGIAYYAGRGVPLNIWDCKTSEMLKNKEFIDILKILGLDPTGHNLDIEYDTIVQANDADCFEEHTFIKTNNGNKMLKDLNENDLVLTHSGEYKPINSIIESKKNKFISIEVNGEPILVSEYHKLIVMRNNKLEVIFAKDLKSDDLLPMLKSK